MKISTCLTSLVALALFSGCQSNRPQASANSRPPEPAGQVTYTVESIPNPHLSATSREGDKPGPVYSSNIIAVYAHKTGESSTNSTNGGAAAPELNR